MCPDNPPALNRATGTVANRAKSTLIAFRISPVSAGSALPTMYSVTWFGAHALRGQQSTTRVERDEVSSWAWADMFTARVAPYPYSHTHRVDAKNACKPCTVHRCFLHTCCTAWNVARTLQMQILLCYIPEKYNKQLSMSGNFNSSPSRRRKEDKKERVHPMNL